MLKAATGTGGAMLTGAALGGTVGGLGYGMVNKRRDKDGNLLPFWKRALPGAALGAAAGGLAGMALKHPGAALDIGSDLALFAPWHW
jgi:hypothetical protein